MLFSISLLALSGLASAVIPHPQGKLTRSDIPPPSFNYKRDLLDRDTAPCKVLSEAYKAANGTGSLVVVDVPPSVGIACLKSVPIDKKRDLELIDWLVPYVEFHSTIDVLVHPPDEYLSAAVDVLGGIQKVKDKLQKDGYASQYDAMTDLRSIFVASHDNHFHYFAPIFNIFDFVRPGLQFISISHDGLTTPEIFMTTDWVRGNKGNLDYFPSAISSVDGIPVIQWIQNNAEQSIASCHDPDALFNTQLTGLPRLLNNAGDMTSTQFEIPDQHIVKFRNGSKLELPNMVRFYKTSDFSHIASGEDVHKEFELPVATTTTPSKLRARATATATSSAEAETPTIAGYPYPVFKGPLGSISGYFLNETGYEDVAVLSILNFDPSSPPDDFNSTEWTFENLNLVSKFFKTAQKNKRDKLVIDMSGNGGGIILLAKAIYRIIFPDGDFDAYDRYRATPFLKVSSEVSFEPLMENLYSFGPFNTKDKNITDAKTWFGPYITKGGQNVTSAALDKADKLFEPAAEAYSSSVDEDYPFFKKAVFKPQNILIVTDGLCGSSCTILTGLLVRNYAVRTLALGGRPLRQAMQAMGGVKGSLQLPKSLLLGYETAIETSIGDDEKALTKYNASASQFPSSQPPPLRDTGIGIAVNGLNSYPKDDVDGYPLHFQYQAANCRLFYTQKMAYKMPEAWKRAAGAAWKGEKCAAGSSTGEGNTIGDDLVPYKSAVRNRATPVKGPASV